MSENLDSIRILSRYYPDFRTLRKNLGHSQIFRPQNSSKCQIVSGYYPDSILILSRYYPDIRTRWTVPMRKKTTLIEEFNVEIKIYLGYFFSFFSFSFFLFCRKSYHAKMIMTHVQSNKVGCWKRLFLCMPRFLNLHRLQSSRAHFNPSHFKKQKPL